jgi:hypothetical protein
MRNIVLLPLLFWLSWGTASAQLGDTFPDLPGELLTGENIVLPSDKQDKLTLVGMAYSKGAEDILKSWYTPMYDKFVLKRGMFDHLYDVNFLFVPMYVGAKKAAYKASIKKMKDSNRKDLYPYLLFYKGGLDPYVDMLGMDNKNQAYLFIIDKQGKILYHTKGMFSENKMEEIEGVLDENLD